MHSMEIHAKALQGKAIYVYVHVKSKTKINFKEQHVDDVTGIVKFWK